MKQEIIRTGAYALILKKGQILLTLQKRGTSTGLWHLPGGKIEFLETPLQALQRELLEEAAFQIQKPPKLLTVVTNFAEQGAYRYHFIGLVYQVDEFSLTNHTPEDQSEWFSISDLDLSKTTEFVKKLKKEDFF